VGDHWTVIGIGNPLRGDDGVGAAVAERVRGMPGIDKVIGDGDPFQVADLLSGPHNVLLIDATRGGGEPGAITVWEPSIQPLGRGRVGASSHGFGADSAIELASALAPLPDRVVVVGIDGAAFEGEGLSAPVVAALDKAVAAVAGVVGDA
jgi:hydrogenase maturation protease